MKATTKMGRPITKARFKRLSLKLSEEEMQLLDDLAKKNNCSRVDAIVKGLWLLSKTEK